MPSFTAANEHRPPLKSLANGVLSPGLKAAPAASSKPVIGRPRGYETANKDLLPPVEAGSMAAFARFFPAASLQDKIARAISKPSAGSVEDSEQALDVYFKKVSQALMLERRRRGIPPPIRTVGDKKMI